VRPSAVRSGGRTENPDKRRGLRPCVARGMLHTQARAPSGAHQSSSFQNAPRTIEFSILFSSKRKAPAITAAGQQTPAAKKPRLITKSTAAKRRCHAVSGQRVTIPAASTQSTGYRFRASGALAHPRRNTSQRRGRAKGLHITTTARAARTAPTVKTHTRVLIPAHECIRYHRFLEMQAFSKRLSKNPRNQPSGPCLHTDCSGTATSSPPVNTTRTGLCDRCDSPD
jgi:hypothetical protein